MKYQTELKIRFGIETRKKYLLKMNDKNLPG